MSLAHDEDGSGGVLLHCRPPARRGHSSLTWSTSSTVATGLVLVGCAGTWWRITGPHGRVRGRAHREGPHEGWLLMAKLCLGGSWLIGRPGCQPRWVTSLSCVIWWLWKKSSLRSKLMPPDEKRKLTRPAASMGMPIQAARRNVAVPLWATTT